MSGTRVSRDLVERVAQLARISLSEREVTALTEDLASILTSMESLPKPGEAEVTAPRPGPTRLRADLPETSLDRDTVLELAPHARGGHFIVPRVIR